MTRRAVAVVGGGLAGLACALASAQAGAAVDLYDQRAQDGRPVAHVDVVPNMLRDLVRLGVGDACVRAGFPYRRTSTIGHRGLPLFSLDAARLAGARYPAALGITHSKLKAVLERAAVDAGVQIHRGEHAINVEQRGDGLRLDLARREPVRTDLAVMACGTHGGLRERVFFAEALQGAAVWSYFLVRRPLGLDEALHATTPAGDSVHVVPVSGSAVGVRLAPRGAPAAMDARALRSLLARFPEPIGALASQIGEDTLIERRVAAPGLLPQPWARGEVIAAGDCAHSLPPHFGQAAAQAVEDAVVLGELLAQPGDVRSLALAYAQRRQPRVQQVMAITLQAARWLSAPDGDTNLFELARSLEQVVRHPA